MFIVVTAVVVVTVVVGVGRTISVRNSNNFVNDTAANANVAVVIVIVVAVTAIVVWSVVIAIVGNKKEWWKSVKSVNKCKCIQKSKANTGLRFA